MAGGLSHLFLKRRRAGKAYRLCNDGQVKTNLLWKRKSSRAKRSMIHSVFRFGKGPSFLEKAEEYNQNQDIEDATFLLKMAVTEEKGNLACFTMCIGLLGPEIAVNIGRPTRQTIVWDGSNILWKEHVPERNMALACPSKFLTMCLNYIQNGFQQDEHCSSDYTRPFFANSWGLEFWKCHNSGKDVLEITKADSITEKIAWVISTAAEALSMKEMQGKSVNSPFLLYLVPSQEKVSKVHQICQPLRVAGIETLILHSGAPLDQQIHSLMEIEPEFLIGTPERLLELLLLDAVDTSRISFMVVDGVEAPCNTSFLNAINSILPFTIRFHRTVVFCEFPSPLNE